MANDAAQPTPISDKEKADVLLELAKNARERFDKRKESEWKLSFGVWTAFGAVAGLIWQAEGSIPIWTCFAVLGIVVLIVIIYYLLVIYWMDNSHRRDLKTSYYWETAAATLIGARQCKGLAPNRDLPHNIWPAYGDDVTHEGTQTKYWFELKVFERFHYAGAGQLAITILMGILLVLVFCVKAFQSAESQKSGTLKLEGHIDNKITIEKQ